MPAHDNARRVRRSWPGTFGFTLIVMARLGTQRVGALERTVAARGLDDREDVVLLVTFARRLAKTIDEDPAATAAVLGQYRLAVARLLDVEPLPEPPAIDVLAELRALPTPRLTS